MSFPELLSAKLRSDADDYLRIEPDLLRGGSVDEVHDARVALRRIRSTIGTTRAHLKKHRAPNLRHELQWVGRELGAVRDADVLVARLGDLSASADVLDRAEGRRAESRAHLVGALVTDRYRSVHGALETVETLVRKPTRSTADEREVMHRLLSDQWDELAAMVAEAGDTDDREVLHRIRIQAKACRYLADLADRIDDVDIADFRHAMRDIQDALGGFLDAHALRLWLEMAMLGTAGLDAVTVAGLAGSTGEEIAASLRAWQKAWDAAQSAAVSGWIGGAGR